MRPPTSRAVFSDAKRVCSFKSLLQYKFVQKKKDLLPGTANPQIAAALKKDPFC